MYFCGFTNILRPYRYFRQRTLGREIYGGRERTVMRQFVSRAVVVFLAVAVFAPLVPRGVAQTSGSVTQISTTPSGLQFSVDGQFFTSTESALWPTGTKHVLWAAPTQQGLNGNEQYIFSAWTWSGGTVPRVATM